MRDHDGRLEFMRRGYSFQAIWSGKGYGFQAIWSGIGSSNHRKLI